MLADLRKLSIYKPMLFKVTEIEFDWDKETNYALTSDFMSETISDTLSIVWEACDGDDLVEEITAATGFCVNSIDYCYVLK